MSDTFGTGNAGQPLEELVETQVLSLDFQGCGHGLVSLEEESRRWTVLELSSGLKNLGVCASRASVTAALAELGLELELSGWAPWRLVETRERATVEAGTLAPGELDPLGS